MSVSQPCITEIVEETWRFLFNGRVQGVGFRPLVYRLAQQHHLRGRVCNQQGCVELFVQGDNSAIRAFMKKLISVLPGGARLQLSEQCEEKTDYYESFLIAPSDKNGNGEIDVPPDMAFCDTCLYELNDPGDRRYRYAFNHCTQCGPRYSIIRNMPYDRSSTTMAGFELCIDCQKEYHDPASRRFHAEIIACRQCGPQLQFHKSGHDVVTDNEGALQACVTELKNGGIVAVKGVGGYHLMCDARNDIAIQYLRDNKPRQHKPLVVMLPRAGEDDLGCVRSVVTINDSQARCLKDKTAPIVLCEPLPDSGLSDLLAPGLREIGVMLAYSPSHQLLLQDANIPLVATSANISGEPVMTDGAEVEQRLAHVASACLHHDRPIEHYADDSVMRHIAGKVRPLRSGRGLAPVELRLPAMIHQPLLAVGGHMKNTVALASRDRVIVSPHIGDLESPNSRNVFDKTIHDLMSLYHVKPALIVCDAHQSYASTRWARSQGIPVMPVWHHHAHASAVVGEYPDKLDDIPWLVFTWDGVGLGEDGSLWGGEALLGRPGQWQRVASFRPFLLPGAEKVSREPWRSALSLCWETGRQWQPDNEDTSLLHQAWQRRLNCPSTTAVGRLFDAAAALTGLVKTASFEGQGPMCLESVAMEYNRFDIDHAVRLPLKRNDDGLFYSDWSPLVAMLLDQKRTLSERAARFHISLANTLLEQARAIRDIHGICRVGFAGGVFQNALLSSLAMEYLEADGFDVFMQEKLPCNDGSLSFGQIIEAIIPSPSGRRLGRPE